MKRQCQAKKLRKNRLDYPAGSFQEKFLLIGQAFYYSLESDEIARSTVS